MNRKLRLAYFLQLTKFGKLPAGARKERIKKSPHFRNGKFQNLNPTPQITGDASFLSILFKFIFKKNKLGIPTRAIPHVKTDLLSLDLDQDIMVWFGHSSYFLQMQGKRILVDPVFSQAASPISFFNRAFAGANPYGVQDLPDIDYLIISHDHWDHLDYPTVLKLKSKVKKVVCSLGVGEHLEYWGYDETTLVELDWNETASLDDGFQVTCLPARHFSGRGFTANQSLWASFLLQSPTRKIYLGGDSGYDTHFADIGKRFDGIDLAILESGQYDSQWKYIHMMPHEVIQAAKELNARLVLPVHHSKFALANHDWDAPLKEITALCEDAQFKVFTPKIGELIRLDDHEQRFSNWWEITN